jgi:hypothetical protein
MLRTRIKRQQAATELAVRRLAAVEASVVALGNEDLLDLADIFAEVEPTPLREMTQAEMRRRNISL